jgi:uncharacterized protein (TIGR03067 family)
MAFKAAMVALLAVAVPVPQRSDDRKQPQESLQGEWGIVRADFGGKMPADAKLGQTRFHFQGDRITILPDDGGRNEEATFHIDASKTPYAIDIQPVLNAKGAGGPARAEIAVKGIFAVKGGLLHLTFAAPGAERPTAFTDPAGSNQVVSLVLQRVGKK